MLHLVKVPLRSDKLASFAKQRGVRLRDLDDGYLVHSVLREIWQEQAPAPFVLRGGGRTTSVWGYSSSPASQLVDHARAFGDPSVLAVLDGLDAIASKEMPVFDAGRRVGFLARVCPVVRLAKATSTHRAGAEVDVFLARCFAAGTDVTISRDDAYRSWFADRFRGADATGATLAQVRVAGIARRRVVRRTQGSVREAKVLERPDVHVDGDLVIKDGAMFLDFLARGIGRHRAFGFGALIVVPPGTTHSPT